MIILFAVLGVTVYTIIGVAVYSFCEARDVGSYDLRPVMGGLWPLIPLCYLFVKFIDLILCPSIAALDRRFQKLFQKATK